MVQGKRYFRVDQRKYRQMESLARKSKKADNAKRKSDRAQERKKRKRKKKKKRNRIQAPPATQFYEALLLNFVSAADAPIVRMINQMIDLGKVRLETVGMSNYFLERARAAHQLGLKRQIERVRASGSFSIGVDETSREGKLLSVCVSYINDENLPATELVAMVKVSDGSAETIVSVLWKQLGSLLQEVESGEDFNEPDLSSLFFDGAAVNTGLRSGVGARVEEKLGYFVYQHVCQKHTLALLLKNSFTQLFGLAEHHQPSLMMLIYLTWYLCNYENKWPIVRSFLLHHLNRAQEFRRRRDSAWRSVDAMVKQHFNSSYADAMAAVRKPEEPQLARWNSVPNVVEYVVKWKPLLFKAFAHMYTCQQTPTYLGCLKEWLEWSGSEQLDAHLLFANEFLNNFWRPLDTEISSTVPFYGYSSCFAAFFAPRRAFEALLWLDSAIAGPKNAFPASYTAISALSNDERDPVTTFLKTVRRCWVKRMGIYMDGAYLFLGLGDPDFAPHVYDVLFSPDDEELEGTSKRLEEYRKEISREISSRERDYEAEITQMALDSEELAAAIDRLRDNPSRQARAAYAARFTDPDDPIELIRVMSKQRADPIHTQAVERTMRTVDEVKKMHGGTTRKESKVSKQSPMLDVTQEALVHNKANMDVKTSLVGGKPRAKEKIAQTLKERTQAISKSEWRDAMAKGRAAAKASRRPRGEYSEQDRQQVQRLEKQRASRRKSAEELAQRGRDLQMQLMGLCFSDERCVVAPTKKRPTFVACDKCGHWYHMECLKRDKQLKANTRKKDLDTMDWNCKECQQGSQQEEAK